MLAGRDFSSYDTIVLHGIVQVFNRKSPIWDWLDREPELEGKRIYLFVTAKLWFLDRLVKDLSGRLLDRKADIVDTLSMATKDTSDEYETKAVRDFVSRIR